MGQCKALLLVFLQVSVSTDGLPCRRARLLRGKESHREAGNSLWTPLSSISTCSETLSADMSSVGVLIRQ